MKRWIFLIALLFLLTNTVSAAEKKDSSLEVSPAYVDIAIEKPDEVQKLEIVYTNHSQKPISLQIFPIDFKQADDFGAIQMISQPGSYSYSLSSFLSLESNTLFLDPGQKKSFMVTIKNREDLSPGGHYAAVVAKIVATTDASPDFVKTSPGKPGRLYSEVNPAVSSLILLRKVGGARFNLTLKDVNWPNSMLVFEIPREINLTFQNEGNIHVIPYGRIDVTDIFGRLIYKGIINTSSSAVFPESRRHIYVDLEKVEHGFPFSINVITIVGQDSLKKASYRYKEKFVYVSPMVLLVLFLLIVGLFLFFRKR